MADTSDADRKAAVEEVAAAVVEHGDAAPFQDQFQDHGLFDKALDLGATYVEIRAEVERLRAAADGEGS